MQSPPIRQLQHSFSVDALIYWQELYVLEDYFKVGMNSCTVMKCLIQPESSHFSVYIEETSRSIFFKVYRELNIHIHFFQ